MPFPESSGKTINDVLKTVGLHNVDTIAGQYGYKGKALWSETAVEVDGPRSGLLALSDQKPMTLADLPPLPVNTNGFNAMRVEPSVLWDTLTQLVRDGMGFAPPEAAGQTAEVLDNLPQVSEAWPGTDALRIRPGSGGSTDDRRWLADRRSDAAVSGSDIAPVRRQAGLLETNTTSD